MVFLIMRTKVRAANQRPGHITEYTDPQDGEEDHGEECKDRDQSQQADACHDHDDEQEGKIPGDGNQQEDPTSSAFVHYCKCYGPKCEFRTTCSKKKYIARTVRSQARTDSAERKNGRFLG